MGARKNQFRLVAGLVGLLATAPACGQTAEDVVVLMDSSGSLGAAGWSNEVHFVIELNHALPIRSQTRLGIIQFATTVATKYNLTQSQAPLTLIDNVVNSMPYTQGETHTKDAIQQAINLFDAQSPVANPRALVLLTDGTPFPAASQDPSGLMSELTSRGIPLLVVGHTAGFNASAYSYAAATGGGVYAYSTVGTATADQFLADTSQYFGLVGLPGDFNHDNAINAGDYVVWRKGLGSTYTQSQYDDWRSHFGQTAASSSSLRFLTAVPECTVLAMVFGAIAGAVFRGRCRVAQCAPAPGFRRALLKKMAWFSCWSRHDLLSHASCNRATHSRRSGQ